MNLAGDLLGTFIYRDHKRSLLLSSLVTYVFVVVLLLFALSVGCGMCVTLCVCIEC